MQDKLQGIANTPAVTERRGCPRLRVTSLMYIDIGSVNGGIVTSLSENGLALTAGATLGNAEFGDGPLRMQIQFPGTPEALEASGEIVWTGSSGKEARVRFVAIAEKARDQIRRWISDFGFLNADSRVRLLASARFQSKIENQKSKIRGKLSPSGPHNTR